MAAEVSSTACFPTNGVVFIQRPRLVQVVVQGRDAFRDPKLFCEFIDVLEVAVPSHGSIVGRDLHLKRTKLAESGILQKSKRNQHQLVGQSDIKQPNSSSDGRSTNLTYLEGTSPSADTVAATVSATAALANNIALLGFSSLRSEALSFLLGSEIVREGSKSKATTVVERIFMQNSFFLVFSESSA